MPTQINTSESLAASMLQQKEQREMKVTEKDTEENFMRKLTNITISLTVNKSH